MSKSIFIVEDEPIIADDLSIMLTHAGFNVLEVADNGAEAIEQMTTHSPDLVLLDIQIKGGLSGIDVARYIGEHHGTPVIFITSYHDALTLDLVEKTNPSAFIAKPFRNEEVLMNVRLALKKSQERSAIESSAAEKIFVRDKGMLKAVRPEAIMYARGEDNYTTLMMEEGHSYVLSHTLKAIEEKLPASSFCRVHKSYVVNLDKILMIEGYSLEVNRQSIPIGKSYKKRLFEKLQVL